MLGGLAPPTLEPRLDGLRLVSQTLLLRLLLADGLAFATLPHGVRVEVDFLEGDEVPWRLDDELGVERVTGVETDIEADTDVGSDDVL